VVLAWLREALVEQPMSLELERVGRFREDVLQYQAEQPVHWQEVSGSDHQAGLAGQQALRLPH
jgi:hypothetical protein